MKCELLEVELTEKHLWLIFKNYYKAEKSLSCLFCYFNSTKDLGLNPVAFDRENSKLFKNIKFVEFGSVDLDLCNFEVGTSIQNWVQIFFNEFKLYRRAGN